MWIRTQNDVLAAFADIRNRYFPTWDTEGRWKLVFGSVEQRRGNSGYCDDKTASIYVHDDAVCAMSANGVRMFLIHEINHDVAAPGHGLRWAKGMEKSARRAEELDETNVAKLLRNEISSYCKWAIFQRVTGLDEPPKL